MKENELLLSQRRSKKVRALKVREESQKFSSVTKSQQSENEKLSRSWKKISAETEKSYDPRLKVKFDFRLFEILRKHMGRNLGFSFFSSTKRK